jgi:hypothetical protein
MLWPAISADLRHHRSDVDDAAPAHPDHLRDECFCHSINASQINGQHLIPQFVGMIDKTVAAPKPCVVDQNFHDAELRVYLLRHSPDLIGLGHVANNGQRPAPSRANLFGDGDDLAGGARTNGDVCPGFGQRDGASLANSPPAAGDQRYFVIQRIHCQCRANCQFAQARGKSHLRSHSRLISLHRSQ